MDSLTRVRTEDCFRRQINSLHSSLSSLRTNIYHLQNDSEMFLNSLIFLMLTSRFAKSPKLPVESNSCLSSISQEQSNRLYKEICCKHNDSHCLSSYTVIKVARLQSYFIQFVKLGFYFEFLLALITKIN